MSPTTPKTNFHIETEAYQGPFELVLELVEARKLLVNELSLSNITEEFIRHVRAQETFPVEETANFIQVAATLLLIKSKSLVPDLPLSEDERESMQELEERLAAYEKLRNAARALAGRFGKCVMLAAPARAFEPVFAPARDLSAAALAEALTNLFAVREEREPLPAARVRPVVTLEEMMDRLLKRIETALSFSFREFSAAAKEKVEIIVSFLALLELVKQGAITAEQGTLHGDIHLNQAAPSSLPRYG